MANRIHEIIVKIDESVDTVRVDDRGRLFLDGAETSLFGGREVNFFGEEQARQPTVRPSLPRLGGKERPSGPRFRRRREKLSHFLRIRIPGLAVQGPPRSGSALLSALGEVRRQPQVARASLALPTGLASEADIEADVLLAGQGYLDPGPQGVNAKNFWAEYTDWADVVSDDGGAPPRVFLCGTAFCPTHFGVAHTQLVTDAAYAGGAAYPLQHGTSALGIVGGRPYEPESGPPLRGTTGVAHGVPLFFSAALDLVPVEDEEQGRWALSEAIDRALDLGAAAGDVIVLEYEAHVPTDTALGLRFVDEAGEEVKKLPGEVNMDIFAAIREATDRDVVVVEPAGNGGHRLGRIYLEGDPEPVWDPGEDSGAVLVGGGVLNDDEDRNWSEPSNRGPRVDCHSWVHDVVTSSCRAGYLLDGVIHDGENEVYIRNFGGTSASVAIVGGVCACLQYLYLQQTGQPLLPGEVRDRLRNDEYGTPQTLASAETEDTHRVGPQPDLMKQAEALQGGEPIVMMRASLGELPREAPPGFFHRIEGWTPDIIIRPPFPEPPFPDPHSAASRFDPLRDWMHRYDPAPVTADTKVHLRVRNGTGQEGRARVELFWSEPSPFQHPLWWNRADRKVGEGRLSSIPPGGAAMADGPVHWTGPSPPTDFVCWTAVLHPSQAAPPAPTPNASTAAYLESLQLPVVQLNAQLAVVNSDGHAAFPVQLRGVPERSERHKLLFTTDLPAGAQLRFVASRRLENEAGQPFGDPGGGDVFHFGGRGQVTRDFVLDARETVDGALGIVIPTGTTPGRYRVSLDQRTASHILGRLTLLLDVPPPALPV